MSLPANLAPPAFCLYCATPLQQRNSNPYCPNYDCWMRCFGRLQKFVDILDIKGVGELTLLQMVEWKFVFTPADLWDLTQEDYLKLDGRGEKHYQKLQEGLKAKELMSVSDFFACLDIEGPGTWENICRVPGLQTIDEILSAVKNDNWRLLAQSVRVSEEKAKEICAEIKQKMSDIEALRQKVRFKVAGKKLLGKVFVITGALSKPRAEVERLIKDNGGAVGSSVTAKTSYLICDLDNSNSTKARKAKDLKVPVIVEAQFLAMLEG